MERDIFWEVFRDTGDPLCWLMTRAGKQDRAKDGKTTEQREKRPSVPG